MLQGNLNLMTKVIHDSPAFIQQIKALDDDNMAKGNVLQVHAVQVCPGV